MLAQGATPKQAPAVWAVIPAYGRPALLGAALASLRGQAGLHGVVVINNSRDAATAEAARAGGQVRVLTPTVNLGTAGGIAWGLKTVFAEYGATHAWIMDDDAQATPGVLAALLAALERADADAAVPLLVDEQERVQWLPGLTGRTARRAGRGGPTVERFRSTAGVKPLSCRWALWASLLVTRRAVEASGWPDVGLWSQFSDLDYTLRLTGNFRAVLAPLAVCRHLPPPSVEGPAFVAKLHSALQNGNYVATRRRYGWRALRHLPGLHWRYLRHYHWAPRAWAGAGSAFFLGAVLGRKSARAATPGGIESARAELARYGVT